MISLLCIGFLLSLVAALLVGAWLSPQDESRDALVSIVLIDVAFYHHHLRDDVERGDLLASNVLTGYDITRYTREPDDAANLGMLLHEWKRRRAEQGAS